MIDWDRIEELRHEIGAEDFSEVAEIFLEELEEVVAKITGSGSSDGLEEQMHFIKGCALNLGFAEMAQFASDGERSAAAGQASDVDLAALATCFKSSRREFLARFGDSAAA